MADPEVIRLPDGVVRYPPCEHGHSQLYKRGMNFIICGPCHDPEMRAQWLLGLEQQAQDALDAELHACA